MLIKDLLLIATMSRQPGSNRMLAAALYMLRMIKVMESLKT